METVQWGSLSRGSERLAARNGAIKRCQWVAVEVTLTWKSCQWSNGADLRFHVKGAWANCRLVVGIQQYGKCSGMLFAKLRSAISRDRRQHALLRARPFDRYLFVDPTIATAIQRVWKKKIKKI